jgi:hypothetical protein
LKLGSIPCDIKTKNDDDDTWNFAKKFKEEFEAWQKECEDVWV